MGAQDTVLAGLAKFFHADTLTYMGKDGQIYGSAKTELRPFSKRAATATETAKPAGAGGEPASKPGEPGITKAAPGEHGTGPEAKRAKDRERIAAKRAAAKSEQQAASKEALEAAVRGLALGVVRSCLQNSRCMRTATKKECPSLRNR